MDKLKNSLTNVELFIEKAKRYTNITELTAELLHLFIDNDDVTKENDISEPNYEFVADGSGELRLVI